MLRSGFSESYQEQPTEYVKKDDITSDIPAEQGQLLDREEIRNSEEYQAGGFALPVNADYALTDVYSVGAFYTDTDEGDSTIGNEKVQDETFGAYLSASF